MVKVSIYLYNIQFKVGVDVEYGVDYGKYVYCVIYLVKDFFVDEGIEIRMYGYGKILFEFNM